MRKSRRNLKKTLKPTLKRMKLQLRGGGGRTGEEIVREFSMDMYTLLCLDWITNKDLLYIAHRTLLSIMRLPGWEGSLGENGYIYM